MTELTITIPDGLHPDTANLVAGFATALADKLHKAEQKYGYDNGWKEDETWRDECAQKLLDHVAKGDPRDVAAYCAFMWHHGWSTSLRGYTPASEVTKLTTALAKVLKAGWPWKNADGTELVDLPPELYGLPMALVEGKIALGVGVNETVDRFLPADAARNQDV